MSKQQQVQDDTNIPRVPQVKPTPVTTGYGLAIFELLRHQRCEHDLTAPTRVSE